MEGTLGILHRQCLHVLNPLKRLLPVSVRTCGWGPAAASGGKPPTAWDEERMSATLEGLFGVELYEFFINFRY